MEEFIEAAIMDHPDFHPLTEEEQIAEWLDVPNYCPTHVDTGGEAG